MADKTILTPRGVARWPFLTKPNTQFKADGEYKVTLELDEDGPGVKEFIDKMDKAVKAKKLKNVPYKHEDGKYSFKLASGFKPQLFDSHGLLIKDAISVGSGSAIVCAVTPTFYDGFGGGVKLYLKAVQIIELVEYSGATAGDYGFGTEEGGFSVENFDALADEDMSDPAIADEEKSKDFDW